MADNQDKINQHFNSPETLFKKQYFNARAVYDVRKVINQMKTIETKLSTINDEI